MKEGRVNERGVNAVWDVLVSLSVVVVLFGSLFQGVISGFNLGILGIPIAGMALLGGYLRRPSVIPRSWAISGVIVLIVGVYALVSPPDTIYGDEKLSRFLTITFFSMAMVSAFWNGRRMRWLWWTWVFAGLVLAVVTIISPEAANGRAAAFESNPVWIARAFSSSFIILVWLMSTRHVRLPLGAIGLIVLVVGMFASGSRGPMIAAAVGSATVFVLSSASGKVAVRGLCLVLLAPVGAILAPSIPGFSDSRIGQLLLGESESTTRLELWASSVEVIKDNPLGVGIGNWAVNAGVSEYLWPHNLALEVAAEFGWLVAIGLIGLVIGTGVALFRRCRSDATGHILLALLVTESIHVSTSGDLNARTFFFVLILGASYAWKSRILADDAGRDSQRPGLGSRVGAH